MSFPERSDNFAEEEFNDIWFDASEESWFDTSEYYIEEDYEELNDYVQEIEKNQGANLPVVEFYQRFLNYFYQGEVLFKKESLYFENFQKLLHDLEWLQSNHQKEIQKQHHKFKVILSRLEEAVNRTYEPENVPTDAVRKRERAFYAHVLSECTKTKTKLEEFFMKDFRRLECEVLTLSDELERQKKMMFDFQQDFAERLGSEERLRWVYYGQQALKIANLEGQEFVAEQFAMIQQLENENEALRRMIIPKENVAINELEEEHDYDGIAEPQLNVMRNEEQYSIVYDEQLDSNSSYYEDRVDVDDGVDGRFYALWSADDMKREFAMAKYDRDMDKRREDSLDLMIDPQGENHDSIKNWILKLADNYEEEDSINIQKPELIPSYQPIVAKSQGEDSNARQNQWQNTAHYGYDGNYISPDETIECEGYQAPSVASGAIKSNFQHHIDDNNGGPPLRRWTPVQSRDSSVESQDASHYGNGNNRGPPLRQHVPLSRRSSPRRRAPYPPPTLASGNEWRAANSSIRRVNASKISHGLFEQGTKLTLETRINESLDITAHMRWRS
ncbi:hypothetical protein EYC84_003744 [Monilinia fructicola]|uniref:Uncharacterized protein n=1 Tax=Monilinia fructicola TaxID=38448 RepID=A0A5M9JX91_MONFR|nr:hypothetical protein EYC84_003744 [Monilinia fructicola]